MAEQGAGARRQSDFQTPRYENPALEIPAGFRELAEKGGQQAKDQLAKMQKAADDMNSAVEASYSAAAKGSTAYGLKILEIVRTNTQSTFDLMGKLASVKSPSEAIELSTSHMRQYLERVTGQLKDLTSTAEPPKPSSP